MKGNNMIELNQATMMVAVQYWLDSQFRDGLAPQVTAVTPGRDAYSVIFQVEVTDCTASTVPVAPEAK